MSNHKVALITGASKRIGKELIKYFHGLHYNVIIHYRESQEAALRLQEECLRDRPHSAVTLRADFNEIHSLSDFIKNSYQAFGRLDVLINNASQFMPTPLGKTDLAQWQNLMISNLTAPYFLSQAIYPYLKDTKGCIVNLTDINAEHPLPNYSVYCAAKAGLNNLTQSLALEMAPDVRVNALALGPILWPEGLSEMNDSQKKRIIDFFPLKRKGNLEDVTHAVSFLIENTFMTGQIITVDGGLSIASRAAQYRYQP